MLSPTRLSRQRLLRRTVAEVEASESADPAPVAEENGTTEENGSEDEAGEEAHEGESASERPDSPDDLDEAAGETPEPEAPADS